MGSEEIEFLRNLLKRSDRRGMHLEIGTAAGGTLCEMMSSFDAAKRPRFVVVDPMDYFPNQLEKVKGNLKQHGLDPAQVDFRVSCSFPAYRQAQERGEKYDFILVDGAHKIRYVMQDLSWAQLLEPGGVILFHDYLPKNPGVRLPVDRFLRKNPHYKRENQVATLLTVRKTAPTSHPEVTWIDHLWAGIMSPVLQAQASLNKRLKR